MIPKRNKKLDVMELLSVGANFLELTFALCIFKLRGLSASAPTEVTPISARADIHAQNASIFPSMYQSSFVMPELKITDSYFKI